MDSMEFFLLELYVKFPEAWYTPSLPPRPTFCMKFPFRPVQQKGGRDREVVKTDGASDGFSPPVFVRERAGIVKRS